MPPQLKNIPSLYEGQFRMMELMLNDTAFRAAFDAMPYAEHSMFEKVTGERTIVEALRRCAYLSPIFQRWQGDDEKFRADRKPWLLY
jgi:hypothetical protein